MLRSIGIAPQQHVLECLCTQNYFIIHFLSEICRAISDGMLPPWRRSVHLRNINEVWYSPLEMYCLVKDFNLTILSPLMFLATTVLLSQVSIIHDYRYNTLVSFEIQRKILEAFNMTVKTLGRSFICKQLIHFLQLKAKHSNLLSSRLWMSVIILIFVKML